MATANFNTQIISSNIDGENTIYNLDDVIDKEFDGPYLYRISDEYTLAGFDITDSNLLVVPSNVIYKLEIVVNNEDKSISAVASANVIISAKLNFNNVVNEAFNSLSLAQRYEETKNNWQKIVSKKTSSDDLADSVRPR